MYGSLRLFARSFQASGKYINYDQLVCNLICNYISLYQVIVLRISKLTNYIVKFLPASISPVKKINSTNFQPTYYNSIQRFSISHVISLNKCQVIFLNVFTHCFFDYKKDAVSISFFPF